MTPSWLLIVLSSEDPDGHGDAPPPDNDWHVLLVHDARPPVLARDPVEYITVL